VGDFVRYEKVTGKAIRNCREFTYYGRKRRYYPVILRAAPTFLVGTKSAQCSLRLRSHKALTALRLTLVE